MSSPYELLSDPNQSLQDAGLYNGQVRGRGDAILLTCRSGGGEGRGKEGRGRGGSTGSEEEEIPVHSVHV